MKKIPLSDPHRQKHFDFFRNMTNPHFSVTAKVKVFKLIELCKTENHKLHHVMAYLISKTATQIPAFLQRIHGDDLIQYEKIVPSFTINTEASSVFSFCSIPFNHDLRTFLDACVSIENQMQKNPSFEDKEGVDNYLFISSLPWIDFTSISHAMNYDPVDSVPRITYGKIVNGEVAVGVQVHHSIINGKEVGSFFKILEEELKSITLVG